MERIEGDGARQQNKPAQKNEEEDIPLWTGGVGLGGGWRPPTC